MTTDTLFLAILLTDKSAQLKMSFVTHYQFRYEGAILSSNTRKSTREFWAVLSDHGLQFLFKSNFVGKKTQILFQNSLQRRSWNIQLRWAYPSRCFCIFINTFPYSLNSPWRLAFSTVPSSRNWATICRINGSFGATVCELKCLRNALWVSTTKQFLLK
jgi:hypothetical protein